MNVIFVVYSVHDCDFVHLKCAMLVILIGKVAEIGNQSPISNIESRFIPLYLLHTPCTSIVYGCI